MGSYNFGSSSPKQNSLVLAAGMKVYITYSVPVKRVVVVVTAGKT